MANPHFIAKLLGIKDTNITFNDNITFKTTKGVTTKILSATLSYPLKACPHCGILNQSSKDMIKNGSMVSTIKLPNMTFEPLVLKLKKQRYLCKHCEKTSVVGTSLVDYGCHISNDIKQLISLELGQEQSMDLIARRYSVSGYTVLRVLKKTGQALEPSYLTLPEHIAIDEFKSVKSVTESMSCILMDAHKRQIWDILPDRKQAAIREYFMRFPYETRQNVKTITMDMYTPYYDFLQRIFPKAVIIIDRFHLVQLLNRSLNHERIRIMKLIKAKRPRDYRKLKQLWKLILKNRDDLNFENYESHRLFDGLVTQKMMVNYMLSVEERFETVYRLINNLKADIALRDYVRFETDLAETRKYRMPKKVRTTFQTLEKYLPAIKNSLTYTLSNGVVEGTNNKIKNIKRSGYGYRNFQNLRYRILISQKLTVKNKTQRDLFFKEENDRKKQEKEAKQNEKILKKMA